jgi:prepilin-type processing-associated H-X9-DG protein
MHNYHDVYKRFPRNAYGSSTWNAWERFSANVSILPYLEQAALYEQFTMVPGIGWGTYYNGPMQQKLTAFLCPSALASVAGSQGWSGPGTNYAWCSGSSIYTAYGGGAGTQNGIMQIFEERSMSDITDGTANTLLVSEILSGDGNASVATYPYDIFYASSGNAPYDAVANKAFPTSAEIAAIGVACQSPAGERSNNGSLWAWYAHAQSLFNTSVTPNWSYPSCGGSCCPGGAHDWGYGVIPPRSLHPGGVNAALADGSVRFVTDSVDLLLFQRLGHRSDGEAIGDH